MRNQPIVFIVQKFIYSIFFGLKFYSQSKNMNIVRCVIFAVVLVVLICIAIFVLLFAFSESSSPTIRQTTNGPVEGIVLTSIMNQEYYAFKGIPYAEPPITGIDPYTDQMVDRRFKVEIEM